VQVEVGDSGIINELNLTGRTAKDSVLITNMFENISHRWRAPPAPDSLHIIVERPSGERCAHWVSEISLTVSRLSSTSFREQPDPFSNVSL
jgi:hypothetical protein